MSQRSTGWVTCLHVALWCCAVGMLGWLIGKSEQPTVKSAPKNIPAQSERSSSDPLPLPMIVSAPMERLLNTPIDVDVRNELLKDVIIELVEEQGGVVRFEEPTILHGNVSLDESVSLQLKQVSLRNVLNLLLHPRKLEWIDMDRSLLVVNNWVAREILETHYYPIPELYWEDSRFLRREPLDSYSMIEFISLPVGHDSWESVGGIGQITPVGDGLLIRNSQAVHTGIVDLYRQIQNLMFRPAGSDYPAQPNETYTPEEHAIFEKLEQPLGVSFVNVSLAKAMRLIAEHHGINVWIDELSLRDEAVSTELEVTTEYANMSLRSALHRMLQEIQLTHVVDDGVLKITTMITAEEYGEARIYDLRRLVPDEEYDYIIELLTTVISPESWPEVGGPAPIELLPGMIAFSHTPHVHQEIAQVLFDMERIVTTPRQQRPAEAPLNRERRAEAQFRKQLRKPVSIDVRQQPLAEVLKLLARNHNLPLWLDEQNCRYEGVSLDAPITAQLSDVSLKDCLSSILSPLKLKAVYDSEYLRVTTEIVANEELLTVRVYDVVDLLEAHAFGDPEELKRQPSRGGNFFQVNDSTELGGFNRFQGDLGIPNVIEPYVPDLKQLALDSAIDMLHDSVEPKTWESVGNPGTAAGFREVLAIRQTDEVHEKIDQWLAKLRRDLIR